MNRFLAFWASIAIVVLVNCALWNYLIAPEYGFQGIKFRVMFPAYIVAKTTTNVLLSAVIKDKKEAVK